MRNQIIFLASFFTLSILALTSCNKDTNYPINDRNNFLVDKIYSYNNDLVAEYHYDNENKLIKKTVTEHLGQNFQMEWSAYSDEFEYQDDLVSKIIHKDITYNTFNYETYIFYNSKQEIIKMEQYRNGQLIDSNSGYRYENGRLVGIWNRPDEPFIFLDTIEYNKSRNVAKYTFRTPDRDPSGNFIPHTKRISTQQFTFDNNLKPNFGLDYLFIYEPLPFNELADIQRHLSENNMLEIIGHHKWKYTYNENGLPSTMETIWQDSQPLVPFLIRITYKKVK